MKLLPVILTWLIFINAHAFESFSYSGRLVNSNGSPVTGYAKLTFELAYSNSISSILCAQTINSVSLSNGVFHVELQFSDCDLTQIVKETPNGHTLSIRVIDRSQTPERSYPFQAIHALPYAYVSKTAKQLDQLGAASGQVLTWEAGEWKPKTIMTEITDGSITAEMLQGNIPRTKLAVGTPDEFVVNDSSGNLSSVDAGTVRSLIGAMTFTDVDQCLSHQKLQMNPGPVFWSCVDDLTEDNTKLPLTGGTVTGPLILSGDPVSALEATTKEYVDSAVDAIDPKVTGSLKFKPNAFDVEIKASSSTTENLEFILPPAKGTAGQALVTDGNGNLSWAAPAAADSSGVGGDLTGTVSNAVIKSGIVTSDKIADGTITNADIAALADIEQSKIKDLALALSNKENKIVGGAAGEYWDGSRSWVILNTSKVPETTNLYFTEERARGAISANGPLIFDDTTGVMSFLSSGASGNLLRSNGTTWESWIPDFLTAESDSLQAVTDRGATTTTFSKFMGGARFSQLGIGTDTPVGVLDIQSTTSGILIPRMSEGQRDLIASPTGMQIYNTTTNKINYHDSSGWKELGLAGSGVQSLTAGSGLLGGTINSTGTISVNTGTGADQIVKLDSSSKLPAVDGSALTNLNPSSLSTFVPINKGGTGLTAFTPDRVYVSDISGSLVPFMCSVDQLFGFDSFGKPYCISYNTFIKQNGNSFGGPAVIGTNDNQPLHFETNGSVKMAILSNGNVGIGVSNPTTKLEVVGTSGTTLKIVDGNQAVGKVLTSDANGIASWQTTTNGTVTNVTASGPITVSSGTTTPVIGIDTANTTTTGALTSTDWNTFNNKLSSSLASGKLFVGNGSNVAAAVTMSGDATLSNAGVLTLGTVPLSKGGTGATTQAGAANAILPPQTGNSGKFLTTNGTNASWESALTSESDSLATVTGRGATTATAVSLNGGANFPGSGVWNSSGRVGIGTASPTNPLNIVNGAVDSSGDIVLETFNPGIQLKDRSTSPDSGDFRIHVDRASTLVPSVLTISSDVASDGVFENNIMTITETGSVGVGTTDPLGPLHIRKDLGLTASEKWLFRADHPTGGGVVIGYEGDGTNFKASKIRSSSNTPLVLGTTNNQNALTINDNKTANYLGRPITSYNPNMSLQLGDHDWTDMIELQSGTFAYSSADRGIKSTGSTWFIIKTRMPIDPKGVYRATVRVKKLDGAGTFYVGASSLDANYNDLKTDLANSYNYFAASNYNVAPGVTYTASGTISGHNLASEGSTQKFDPGAKFFDLVIITNYTGSGSSVIESVEVYKEPTPEPWRTPVFENGWVDYAGGYSPVAYYKDTNGIVHLRGLVKNGTVGSGYCVFTLPADYRPPYRKLLMTQTSPNAMSRLDVRETGCVEPTTGSSAWISLDGLSFRAAP